MKKRFLIIGRHQKYKNHALNFVVSTIHADVILSQNKYKGRNGFEFLNLYHCFNDWVDWNFNGNGKLWNYNLQYFDYLLDDSIDLTERMMLLEDFSKKLLEGTIVPEPYPTSLRIVNTILFISINKTGNENITNALKIQINYLEHNLEYHLQANHLLENILALYIASFSIADVSLFKKSELLLHTELEKQILPDGGHYECSVMYHSIILSKLLLCIDVAERCNAFDVDVKFLRSKAELMIGWLNAYSFPDGSWALINDSSTGIAPDTFSLNKASFSLNIAARSCKIAESGYRKIKNSDSEIIIKVGDIIPEYQPGHTHADMLSFCFWKNDKQYIVDSSISTYNNNPQRHKERSTNSHNTIFLGNKNQSDVWSSFRIGKRASCKIVKDSSSEIIAEHNGYNSLGINHQRRFSVAENGFLIEDLLLGQYIKGEMFLHFDYSIQPLLRGNVISFMNFTIEFINGYSEMEIVPYLQPIGFNKTKAAYKFVAKVNNTSSFSINITG